MHFDSIFVYMFIYVPMSSEMQWDEIFNSYFCSGLSLLISICFKLLLSSSVFFLLLFLFEKGLLHLQALRSPTL